MLNFEESAIHHLIEEYLKPLRCQLRRLRRETYDRWLPTIVVLDSPVGRLSPKRSMPEVAAQVHDAGPVLRSDVALVLG